MKVKIHFIPVIVDLPEDIVTEPQEIIEDYINENWSSLIDPSLPKIAELEEL